MLPLKQKAEAFSRRVVRFAAGSCLSEKYKIKYDALSSGARLITRRVLGGESLQAGISITGAGKDAQDSFGYPAGTAHLLEHVLLRESGRYSYENLRQIKAFFGVAPSAHTGLEQMRFSLGAPRDHAMTGLDILVDAMSNPTLSERAIEAERKVVLSEFVWRSLSRGVPDFWQLVLSASFEDYYKRQVCVETKESLRAITRAQIETFYRQTFASPNATIIVQSPFSHQKIKDFFEEKWTLPSQGGVPLTNYTYAGNDIRKHIDREGVMVTLALPPSPINSEKAYVLNNFFTAVAKNNIEGALRKGGLIYTLGFGGERSLARRSVHMSFDAFPENVEPILNIIGKSFQQIAEEGLPERLNEEKRLSEKSSSRRSRVIDYSMESIEAVVSILGYIPQPDMSYQRLLQITNDDIKQMARSFLTGEVGFAAAGDIKDLPTPDRVKKLVVPKAYRPSPKG